MYVKAKSTCVHDGKFYYVGNSMLPGYCNHWLVEFIEPQSS
jgi:hypothetical protein